MMVLEMSDSCASQITQHRNAQQTQPVGLGEQQQGPWKHMLSMHMYNALLSPPTDHAKPEHNKPGLLSSVCGVKLCMLAVSGTTPAATWVKL